jgi:hypothetical protein
MFMHVKKHARGRICTSWPLIGRAKNSKSIRMSIGDQNSLECRKHFAIVPKFDFT